MPSEDERKAPRRRGPAGLWHGEQTDGDGGGDRRPRTAQKEHTGRGEGPGSSPRETASPGHPPPAESGADSEETVPVDRATVPGLSASEPEGSPAAQDDTHEAPGISAPDAGSTMPQPPEAPAATVPSAPSGPQRPPNPGPPTGPVPPGQQGPSVGPSGPLQGSQGSRRPPSGPQSPYGAPSGPQQRPQAPQGPPSGPQAPHGAPSGPQYPQGGPHAPGQGSPPSAPRGPAPATPAQDAVVEAFLSGAPRSSGPRPGPSSGPAQGHPGAPLPPWPMQAPPTPAAPPAASAPSAPPRPAQAPPAHAQPSHLTGAWTNEDDGRYPEPSQGSADAGAFLMGGHERRTRETSAGVDGTEVQSTDRSGQTHGPQARVGPAAAPTAFGSPSAPPAGEPSVPARPEPMEDPSRPRGAFGPPPPNAQVQPTGAATPVSSPEPSAAPASAPPGPDRPGTVTQEPGGTGPGATADDLHTPAPGGLEERIVAVRPVPGVPWKRALFRATRGRVNLESP